jgi:hypothetical protein
MNMEKYTKNLLLVIEELKNDLYFYRDNNLINFNASAEKVVAVWDLEALGGIKIHNKGEERIPDTTTYEFQILIIQPAFDGIYQKCIKEVIGQKELKLDVSALLKIIPENKKGKFMRKIAEKFVKEQRIDNWRLASCIHPTLLYSIGNRKKFTKKDYANNKAKYDKQIKSRLRSLNGLWERQHQKIKFLQNYSELTMIQ